MDYQAQEGLLRTHREAWRTRGIIPYVVAVTLMTLYTALYFRDSLGLEGTALDLEHWAQAIGLRSQWFLYGLFYTVAMTGGAIYFLRHHGNSRYHRIRISVNLFVQIVFAFSLPMVMPLFFTDDPNEYWKFQYYFSYLWPLAWYNFHPSMLEAIPVVLSVYSIVGALFAAPVLAYFLGKRWYCSWVCGCGGLANTFGDPWRHLTSKSTKAWRFEKASLYTVLLLAILSTFLLFLDHLVGANHTTFHKVIGSEHWWSMKHLYGYVVGSILAGVIGTGLYPILGPRVWCRNFCPMAALLGVVQKLGRFRITVKPDMCISCGNCSSYCEMGIDVRSYAQSNESFTRAACVGCGMCAHMCPRGVLKLENKPRLASDKQRQRLPIVDL